MNIFKKTITSVLLIGFMSTAGLQGGPACNRRNRRRKAAQAARDAHEQAVRAAIARLDVSEQDPLLTCSNLQKCVCAAALAFILVGSVTQLIMSAKISGPYQ